MPGPFVRGPLAAVITDQNGFALNLGGGSGSFTQGPTPIVITDILGNQYSIGGGAGIAATLDLTGQTANLGSTLVYAVPSAGAGLYRVNGFIVVTTAATTSTLPNLNVTYTDLDTGVSNTLQVTNTNSANTAGAAGGAANNPTVIRAKASTNINISTANYASSPAATMQYAIHVDLEFMGTVSGSTLASGTLFPLLAPNGSASAPSYSFSASTNTGVYYSPSNFVAFATGGSVPFGVGTSGPQIASGTPLQFAASGINSASDTGLSRTAAGVLALGNGSQGDVTGILNLNGIGINGASGSAGNVNGTSGWVLQATGTSQLQVSTTGLNIFKTINQYNGITTVGNGIPSLVAKYDATLQQANIATTTIYTVPAGQAGTYRLSGYGVITQAGTTSTFPNLAFAYTDLDSSIAAANVPFTQTFANGAAGASTISQTSTGTGSGTVVFQAKAATTIGISTTGYASTGTVMQFAVHFKLEYLG